MFKSKLFLITSVAFAASGALADSGELANSAWVAEPSTLSREQVRQELRQARARGERDYGELGIVVVQTPSTPRSRAKVLAELREAVRLGLIVIGDGDIPVASAEQERLIAKAGRDAAERVATAAVDSKD